MVAKAEYALSRLVIRETIDILPVIQKFRLCAAERADQTLIHKCIERRTLLHTRLQLDLKLHELVILLIANGPLVQLGFQPRTAHRGAEHGCVRSVPHRIKQASADTGGVVAARSQ
jgi:hypothetical protein